VKFMVAIFLAVNLLSFSTTALADFPLSAYQKFEQQPQVAEKLDNYVIGLGRGVFWANEKLEVLGQKPLFCMPNELHLDEGLIKSLLDQEIRDPLDGKPYKASDYIEVIMLNAFQHRFPCK